MTLYRLSVYEYMRPSCGHDAVDGQAAVHQLSPVVGAVAQPPIHLSHLQQAPPPFFVVNKLTRTAAQRLAQLRMLQPAPPRLEAPTCSSTCDAEKPCRRLSSTITCPSQAPRAKSHHLDDTRAGLHALRQQLVDEVPRHRLPR